LEAGEHALLVRERDRLVDAIASRKAERARRLAERHVAVETERLIRRRLRAYGSA
jgi:DNA-binding FadR family transcriptional regulator